MKRNESEADFTKLKGFWDSALPLYPEQTADFPFFHKQIEIRQLIAVN